jgi:hypothetical protein
MLINYALEDARVTERLCVEVHTSHCAACRKELEDTCELIAASERVLSHPYPVDDFDQLMARIAAGEMPPRDIPVGAEWSWRGMAARTAAAAALVGAIFFTAPVARNAGHVMRELQEVSNTQQVPLGSSVQVPVLSEPFVKRVLEMKNGYESVHRKDIPRVVEPLLP